MNNTVEKMTFFRFPKVKWLQYTGEVNKCTSCWCQIFSGFNTPKSLKSVNFWQSYLKNKRWTFSGHSVYWLNRPIWATQTQPDKNTISLCLLFMCVCATDLITSLFCKRVTSKQQSSFQQHTGRELSTNVAHRLNDLLGRQLRWRRAMSE